ncbi:MAG: amidohydrolase family protein, partial [Caldisericia bacterium]|nr:amidohydrolase family protein [Caldisericia bacterium]
AEKVIDAQGKLVTESFVNPHLHLCKVYTFMMMEEEALKDYHGENMGKAMTAIELAALVKAKYNESWIVPNVRKALNHAVRYGVLHVRGFADVDSKAKLEGIKALLKAKEEFKDILTLQVVAFPQDGVVREKGAYELVEESLKMGADVVGGIPWIEYTEEDEKEHIDKMFELAKKYDRDISMLVDDAGDPTLKTLEMLTVKAIKEGFIGRVLAHHARAMQFYPTPYLMKLIALLKKGEVGVVTDPQTGPLHARVREMLEEGVLVVLGQDDISDAYYPYGRNNMLEVAFLVSHILWMTTRSDMEKLYDMITIDAAKSIGLKNHKLEEGNPANLVVLNEDNVLEALRYHREPKFVISNGKLVDLDKYEI